MSEIDHKQMNVLDDGGSKPVNGVVRAGAREWLSVYIRVLGTLLKRWYLNRGLKESGSQPCGNLGKGGIGNRSCKSLK